MELNKVKNIYIIGIEGAGTSALACILKAQGKNVVGSDEGDHFYYDVLKKKNIKVFHKFSKNNLKKAFSNKEDESDKIDLVIYSTTIIPEQNEELAEVINAKEIKNILSYPQALGIVFNQAKTGIAICGTHGKTTTTAMLATVMQENGLNPTALVGSKVLEWGNGVLIGDRDYFIIEADEYQNKLQYYNPKGVILTSADYDHPDFFKTEEEYIKTFKDFIARIPKEGFLVAYQGDKNVVEISKVAKCKVVFYNLEQDKNKFTLEMPGEHNLLNALAVLKVVEILKLNKKLSKNVLAKFQGTVRRFQIKGKYKETLIIDDYAHHPTEVKATLQATKEHYPNKIIKCIFHPHTFTRTKALLEEFAKSFTDAHEVYLLDIFGSAREKQGNISRNQL